MGYYVGVQVFYYSCPVGMGWCVSHQHYYGRRIRDITVLTEGKLCATVQFSPLRLSSCRWNLRFDAWLVGFTSRSLLCISCIGLT